jgi:dCMP deaminase
LEQKKVLDDFGRPSWDTYFMALALAASQRSIDPNTKHGCVVVADDKTILSLGYNGPPRGCVDANVPLTAPDKYDWMVHSESAAIINAARRGIPLLGSTFYITGHPCHLCLREIINCGAERVIYGPISSNCVDERSRKIVKEMLIGQPLEMIEFLDTKAIEDFLTTSLDYLKRKIL